MKKTLYILGTILAFALPAITHAAVYINQTGIGYAQSVTPPSGANGGSGIDIGSSTLAIPTSTFYITLAMPTAIVSQVYCDFKQGCDSPPSSQLIQVCDGTPITATFCNQVSLFNFSGYGNVHITSYSTSTNAVTFVTDGTWGVGAGQNIWFVFSGFGGVYDYYNIDGGYYGVTHGSNTYNYVDEPANTCVDNVNGLCVGGGAIPAISFIFPSNGTTTPPFSPWIIETQNTTSTDQYQIQINWTQINNGCGYSPIYFTQTYCQIYNDTSVLFNGTTSTQYVPIKRPDRNLNYPDDGNNQDEWQANAYLQDITNPVLPFTATTTTQFYLLRYTIANAVHTGENGTSTYINPFINSSGNLQNTTTTSGYTQQIATGIFNQTTTCPTDPLGICYIMNFLFNPNTYPGATQYLQNEYATLQTVPPFAAFYQLASTTETGLNNFNSPQNLNGVNIGILGFPNQQQVTIATVNSTTFYGTFANNTTTATQAQNSATYMETFISAWLWIAAAIRILHIFTIA